MSTLATHTPSAISATGRSGLRSAMRARVLVASALAWSALLGGCTAGAAPDDGVPAVYRSHCLACHGASGDGRGPAAGSLRPAPRDFADAAWQTEITDVQLRAVIRDGGAAHGKSPHMPGHAHLSEADLDLLVAWIREQRR